MAGTVCFNRFANTLLSNKHVLFKHGRGATAHRISENEKIRFTKWDDNKEVNLTSNYVGISVVN